MAAFSSVEPRPSYVQTFWVHAIVKLATGAVLPGGWVTVTWRTRGTVVTWSWLSTPRMVTV